MTNPQEEVWARALRSRGWTVVAPEVEPEPDRCFKCGATAADQGWNLDTFDIIIAKSEEGFSYREGLLCGEHLSELCGALVGLGYGLHKHGGICYLEDTGCPGARGGECPTPENAMGER